MRNEAQLPFLLKYLQQGEPQLGVTRIGIWVVAGLIWIVGGSEMQAELVWSEPRQRVAITTLDETATARFTFRNNGPAAVRLVRVESGCSCTTARLPEGGYAPGEAGSLELLFTRDTRVERQEREILVFTDEEGANPYRLHLTVDIKEWTQVQPRLLLWPERAAHGEKKVQVTVLDPGLTVVGEPAIEPAGLFVVRRAGTSSSQVLVLAVQPEPQQGRRQALLRLPVTVAGKTTTTTVVLAVR